MHKYLEVQSTKDFASTFLNDIFFRMAVNRVLDAAPEADVVSVDALESWLHAIAMNNVGVEVKDMATACEVIIDRLDGLRRFSKEREV